MGMSGSKKARRKLEQEGVLNPEMNRGQWHRKPHTQVVRNEKANQRRSQCRRKGSREGADLFYTAFVSVGTDFGARAAG